MGEVQSQPRDRRSIIAQLPWTQLTTEEQHVRSIDELRKRSRSQVEDVVRYSLKKDKADNLDAKLEEYHRQRVAIDERYEQNKKLDRIIEGLPDAK